jgi:hypothetical protein
MGCYIQQPFRKLHPEVKVFYDTREKTHGSHIHIKQPTLLVSKSRKLIHTSLYVQEMHV